ncbi:GNAT family N-acetyltransferase [Segniliparus rugosus]|uniref:GNAT family N-acetyltransferase n=1 Tax=Segniliparus rugosus TaxID=286804 RepID=UPI00146FB997|nr:GNAT family N-acetyltransferase [Segniliparus rugosus]
MVVRAHGSVAEFWDAARSLYEADPVRHTFTLSALAAYSSRGGFPRLLLTVWSGDPPGSPLGAMLQINQDDPLRLSALPTEQIRPVVAAFAAADPDLAAVDGPEAVADAFARAWCAEVGATASPPRHNMLHELGELVRPAVRGGARVAGLADLDLLVGWTLDYEAEDYGRQSAPATMARILRSQLLGSDSATVIWEDEGEPVAFASARRPVVGVARVGPVFTPKERRGNGYGIAVAGAATAWAREEAGAERVVLFTDESSPKPNSIYAKLGYRPVERFSEIRFQRP